MDFWRRASGKPRLNHIRYEDKKKQMKVPGSIIANIEKQHLIWYGRLGSMGRESIFRQ